MVVLILGWLGSNITKGLLIQNLDNMTYNISISHNNLDYSIISQCNVSPLSSIVIPISMTPIYFSSHHSLDKISITYGNNRQIHSMVTAIIPTVSIVMPSRYANASIFGEYVIDDVISYNYTGYYSELYINESFTDSKLLNGSGWFNYTPYLFGKGYYNISTRLYDSNDNFLYVYNQIYYIDGLDVTFVINMAPLIIGYFTTGNVIFNDSTVSGVVDIWLLAEYRSGNIRCEVKNGRGDFSVFWGVFSANNPIKVWPVKANYLGSEKHNPTSSVGSLNVFPQLKQKPFEVPYWIWLIIIGLSIFFGILLVYNYRQARYLHEVSDEIESIEKGKRRVGEIRSTLDSSVGGGEPAGGSEYADIEVVAAESSAGDSLVPFKEFVLSLESLFSNTRTSKNKPNASILHKMIQAINNYNYQNLTLEQKLQLNILKYRVFINLDNYKAAQNIAFVIIGIYAEQGNYKERDVWKRRLDGLEKRGKLYRQGFSSQGRKRK